MCFWCCATHLLYEYTHSSIGEQGKGIEEKKEDVGNPFRIQFHPIGCYFFFLSFFVG